MQRLWEIHLARLSSTLSFSGSWNQALFVLRHITAICHHLLLPLFKTTLVHTLKPTQCQSDLLWVWWQYLKEMQIIPWKNYLPAWRAFGYNYKTKVKTKWIIIYINVCFPIHFVYFTSFSLKGLSLSQWLLILTSKCKGCFLSIIFWHFLLQYIIPTFFYMMHNR